MRGWILAARHRLLRIRYVGRKAWRRMPRSARLSVAIALAAMAAGAGGVGMWANLAAARLDLDAAQGTALVFAAGRALRPGVSIRAVSESLERLRYREVTAEPVRPGEFRRTGGRWEVHLRPESSEPGKLLRLSVRGPWIVDVTGATAGADVSDAALEPELLTGVAETGLERRRPLALGEMSRFIPAAVLAAEDHRFFDHAGLDLMSVGRALIVNTVPGRDHAGR